MSDQDRGPILNGQDMVNHTDTSEDDKKLDIVLETIIEDNKKDDRETISGKTDVNGVVYNNNDELSKKYGANEKENNSNDIKTKINDPKIALETRIDNGAIANGKKFEEIKELKQNGEKKADAKDLLAVPRGGPRKSFMEQESAKERRRQALLKQCSAILRQSDQKFTKETLNKAFQDEIIELEVDEIGTLDLTLLSSEYDNQEERPKTPSTGGVITCTEITKEYEEPLYSAPNTSKEIFYDDYTKENKAPTNKGDSNTPKTSRFDYTKCPPSTSNDLLERIFRLFVSEEDERNARLPQDDWLQFLKQRLTEEKQLELVEQLESVAYVVAGNEPLCCNAFKKIMQNRVVTNKLLRAVDTDGDGAAAADDIMDLLCTASSSRACAGFDRQSVDRLERLFRETVGDQREITEKQFQKILDSKNPFFTERVFHIFDEDSSGSISLHEFIAAAHRFAGQTPDDKIRFLFEVYDIDGDGLIQQRELQHVLWACMEENGMAFSDEQLAQLTRAMFEDADVAGRGAITYEALRDQLAKHEGLTENLSISIDRWLVPPKPEPCGESWRQRLQRLRPRQLSRPYLRNNPDLVGYLLVYTLVNVGLFAARCQEYAGKSFFLMMARAFGQCLNFNCAWVLVLMLRRCITTLRVRSVGAWLPLDHHIYLHKLTGALILVFSLAHTVMHLFNFSMVVLPDPAVNSQNYTLFEWLLTERPHLFGLVHGCANPTGFALLAVLLVMIVCSQPFIRRSGSFEVFYWTHLLYVPFWLLLIFHAPNFWKWFVLPGAVYIAERVLRLVWLRSERGKTYVSSGLLLPSRVTHLVVKRPPLFHFHAGDYVFVNVPAIARYEWHPFTISSAPDQPDYIWLHIRGVGQWTNRLYSYFEQEHARLHANTAQHSPVARLSSLASNRSRKSSTRSDKKRSVDFAPQLGHDNPAFAPDSDVQANDDTKLQVPGAGAGGGGLLRGASLLTPLRFHKSRSMPDVYKQQKHAALRDYMRSESESQFAAGDIQAAREPRGSGYSALHDRALAHSFRYMRHKPAMVAFKTPSEDSPRRRSNDSILTIARRRLSKTISPDKDVEAEKADTEPSSPDAAADDGLAPPDYPIGKPLEIYVDGPYGAASSHIFRAQHAALIAAGIGVTPFASILQSIMYRYWSARSECPKCGHRYTADLPHHNMSLNKVDFFWINREQRSFEWFVSLLSQLEIEQAELGGARERFLDMHMYITSALQRTDMKAVGLQLALELLHEREKRDLITGLKTRTNAGRPNWDKVFQQLQQQNKGKVTVFYCGPPQLARALRSKCERFGFHFRKEVF